MRGLTLAHAAYPTPQIAVTEDGSITATIPERLAARNLIIEATCAGIDRSITRFSNSLQIEVCPMSSRSPGICGLVSPLPRGLLSSMRPYSNLSLLPSCLKVTEPQGQLRVLHTSGKTLPATYVKVFARYRDGAVRFYKVCCFGPLYSFRPC